jgi:outer membrane protein assembly factor BamB
MVVDASNGNFVKKELEHRIGPVHKDLVGCGKSIFSISDSCGELHVVDVTDMIIKRTHELSTYPLSPTLLIGDDKALVGSYDGSIRCVRINGDGSEFLERECLLNSSIYSSPAIFGNSLLVGTTAGDIVSLELVQNNGELGFRPPEFGLIENPS